MFTGVLIASAGLGACSFALVDPHSLILRPNGLFGVGVAALAVAGIVLLLAGTDSEVMHRHFGLAVHMLLLVAPGLVSLGQYMVGPRTLIAVVLYVEVPILAIYLVPTVAAGVAIALIAVELLVVFSLDNGYPAALGQWVFVIATLIVIGIIFGGLLRRAVDEAANLSRLRRFLSPQIAEALLARSNDDILRPHRRQIAVFFADLRGFTTFTGGAEPEEVVDALDQYYQVVGEVLHRYNATVGTFAGDESWRT